MHELLYNFEEFSNRIPKEEISSEMPNTDSKYMRFLYGYTELPFTSLTTEFPMPAYLEMTCAS